MHGALPYRTPETVGATHWEQATGPAPSQRKPNHLIHVHMCIQNMLEEEVAMLVGLNATQLEEEEQEMLPASIDDSNYIKVLAQTRTLGQPHCNITATQQETLLPAASSSGSQIIRGCLEAGDGRGTQQPDGTLRPCHPAHEITYTYVLYPQVRNHVLARWRADVRRYLSLEDACAKIQARFHPLVAHAWRFLSLHGYINFGVAPALLKEPGGPVVPGNKTVIVIGAGLAGGCV